LFAPVRVAAARPTAIGHRRRTEGKHGADVAVCHWVLGVGRALTDVIAALGPDYARSGPKAEMQGRLRRRPLSADTDFPPCGRGSAA